MIFPRWPDSDQMIHDFSRPRADLLMTGLLILAEFKHIAQDSDLLTLDFIQQVQGGDGGFRCGVVGVIQDQCAAFGFHGDQPQLGAASG